MSAHREGLLMQAIDMLENWPDNGRPEQHPELQMAAAFGEAIGWIERVQQHEPCKGCGHSRPTYSYFRISSAGQAALDLFRLCERGVDALADEGLVRAEHELGHGAALKSERAADLKRAISDLE